MWPPFELAFLQDYVELMASALIEAKSDLRTPAAEHLQGLVNELFAWSVWVNDLNPHIFTNLHSIKLDSASLVPYPEPQLLLNMLVGAVLCPAWPRDPPWSPQMSPLTPGS